MAKGDFLFVIEKVADFTVGNDMLFSKGNNLHVCNRWKVVGVTGLCLQVGLCSTYWSPKEGYSITQQYDQITRLYVPSIAVLY